MSKENSTLSLYRANRERARKAADAALAKAVASVTKKAAKQAARQQAADTAEPPTVDEDESGATTPSGDPDLDGDPAK